MRSPSACSSISSHTQPQKVQVAFFTTVRLMEGPELASFIFARTGRHDERSAQLSADAAPPDSPRHVSAGSNLLPRHWRLRISSGRDRGSRRLLEGEEVIGSFETAHGFLVYQCTDF